MQTVFIGNSATRFIEKCIPHAVGLEISNVWKTLNLCCNYCVLKLDKIKLPDFRQSNNEMRARVGLSFQRAKRQCGRRPSKSLTESSSHSKELTCIFPLKDRLGEIGVEKNNAEKIHK